MTRKWGPLYNDPINNDRPFFGDEAANSLSSAERPFAANFRRTFGELSANLTAHLSARGARENLDGGFRRDLKNR
jgi:hypothetical protein